MWFLERNQKCRSLRVLVFIWRVIMRLNAFDTYFVNTLKNYTRPQSPLISTSIEEGSFFRAQNQVFHFRAQKCTFLHGKNTFLTFAPKIRRRMLQNVILSSEIERTHPKWYFLTKFSSKMRFLAWKMAFSTFGPKIRRRMLQNAILSSKIERTGTP